MLRLFYLLILFPLLLAAKETICLNMIVKNESQVIRRCLDSVKPYIDYWVILDTGSTDGTQEIIKEYMSDIPGELYESPWKNFGESRTEALYLAQGYTDYILFMDADDMLEFEDSSGFPPLTADLYNMWRGTKHFSYIKHQLVRADLPWKWIGVTHEYLACNQYFTSDILENVRYMSGDGGASSKDPEKFLKNVRLLEEGIKNEPDNTRYAFYLAESYYDAGNKGKALEWYQKRILMGGWDEEIYWSKLRIAHLLRAMDLPSSTIIASYLDAHYYRPHRAEALYYLAEYFAINDNYKEAYECIREYFLIPRPDEKDHLFNEDWIEEYGMLFQLSICAYYVGHYEASLKACNELLINHSLPEGWRKQTEINRSYPLAKLKELRRPKS